MTQLDMIDAETDPEGRTPMRRLMTLILLATLLAGCGAWQHFAGLNTLLGGGEVQITATLVETATQTPDRPGWARIELEDGAGVRYVVDVPPGVNPEVWSWPRLTRLKLGGEYVPTILGDGQQQKIALRATYLEDKGVLPSSR